MMTNFWKNIDGLYFKKNENWFQTFGSGIYSIDTDIIFDTSIKMFLEYRNIPLKYYNKYLIKKIINEYYNKPLKFFNLESSTRLDILY